jgi:hypothetical protein
MPADSVTFVKWMGGVGARLVAAVGESGRDPGLAGPRERQPAAARDVENTAKHDRRTAIRHDRCPPQGHPLFI